MCSSQPSSCRGSGCTGGAPCFSHLLASLLKVRLAQSPVDPGGLVAVDGCVQVPHGQGAEAMLPDESISVLKILPRAAEPAVLPRVPFFHVLPQVPCTATLVKGNHSSPRFLLCIHEPLHTAGCLLRCVAGGFVGVPRHGPHRDENALSCMARTSRLARCSRLCPLAT